MKCPKCNGTGLGPSMFRPEIAANQRDPCYTCQGTGEEGDHTLAPHRMLSLGEVRDAVAQVKRDQSTWRDGTAALDKLVKILTNNSKV